MNSRRWLIAVSVFVSIVAAAQQREYRDPRSFPFNEAVQEPAAVIVTQRSTTGYGNHPRGTNDPLFRAQELLGRPTRNAITINVEAIEDVEAYFEYGTAPGDYSGRTPSIQLLAGEPMHVPIEGLEPNSRYYYRMRYMEADSSYFRARSERSFHTARPPGSEYTFKFVFSHNLIGGLNMRGQMRGGIETVKYKEMGGYNLDGTWGFDDARPGWAMPIHQLLVAHNATIYFHGHGHLYVKQDLDGIVYQEGPVPARSGLFDATNSARNYNYNHGTVIGGSGYLRVKVSPDDVTVDYVQTYLPHEVDATRRDGMVADSYTIDAR